MGDTEEVTLKKGVGWSGMNNSLAWPGQLRGHSYTDPKESRGVQASGGRGSGDSSNTGELLGNPLPLQRNVNPVCGTSCSQDHLGVNAWSGS